MRASDLGFAASLLVRASQVEVCLGDSFRFGVLGAGPIELQWQSLAAGFPAIRWSRAGRKVHCCAGVPSAYLPDHSPISLGSGPDGTGVFHEAAITLTQDADLLVHDSQHTAAELPRLGFLGHSAVEYAAALVQRASARQLALFHHDPWRTDAQIDALVAQHAAAPVRVFAAHDGMIVNLP